MNTDSGNLYISPPDLEALSTAPTMDAFTAAMERAAHAIGMSHFVVLRLFGMTGAEVRQRSHNAPAESFAYMESEQDVTEWPVVRAMREGLKPVLFGAGPGHLPEGPAGFRTGVAVARPEARSRTVLVLGRDGPDLELQHGTRLMATTILAATYASVGLEALLSAACPFTERELECLRYAMCSMSAKETARALGLSFRTIEEYLARARDRLGVSSSTAAAWRALDNGWITLDEINRLSA